MTLVIVALLALCAIAAFILARYYEPPPALTRGRIVRYVLAVAALALLGAVGLNDPLPVSVLYLPAAGALAMMVMVVVADAV